MRYIAAVLLTAGGALGALAAINWQLDPFAVFGKDFARGELPRAQWPSHLYARVHKPARLESIGAKALILGTSRASIGVPASGWPWKDSAYNAAIAGGNPDEIRRLLAHARARNSYDRLIVTLDFPVAFEGRREQGTKERFAMLLPRQPTLLEQLKFDYLEPLMLLVSQRTLYAARCETELPTAQIGPDGTELARGRLRDRAAMAPLDYWRATELTYARLWRNYRALPPERRAHRLGAYQESLRQLFSEMSGAAGDVDAVLLPIHPWHIAVMTESGMWDEYESWVGEVAALSEHHLGRPVRDYSTAACVWEHAPDHSSFERWFLDPSHLSPEYGRDVMADVLGEAPRVDCATAASLVTAANAQEHVRDLRALLGHYAAQAPADYAAARDFVRDAPRLVEPNVWTPSLACRVWAKF